MSIQLEWIKYLHQIRTPFLDSLIKLFDFFDRQEFLFILIPFIWLGYTWIGGIRLFYTVAFSHIVNHGLKHWVALPHPFHEDSTLGVIQVGGYSFPSGAAQTAVLLSGLLIIYWNNRWKWAIAATYTLLISFSRVYLGVHFPTDILGGWIVGFLLLGVYLLLFPKITSFFKELPPLAALLISQSLLLLLMFCLPSKSMISICACAAGLGLGVFINRRFSISLPSPTLKRELLMRASIGSIGVFLLHFLVFTFLPLSSLREVFFQFTIGLWISFIAYSICLKLRMLCAKER